MISLHQHLRNQKRYIQKDVHGRKECDVFKEMLRHYKCYDGTAEEEKSPMEQRPGGLQSGERVDRENDMHINADGTKFLILSHQAVNALATRCI